ncbi:MAG: 2-isopropylmalate synthase [Spirochaetaceae bacterium]|nr:2-isopropylmalate synthase [Spirochaetaceae bacterium]
MPVERRILVLDTTLRDGDQAAGFAFSAREKLKLGLALAEAGVDIVETGFPVSSRADFELCRRLAGELGAGRLTAVMCRGRLEDIRRSAEVFSGGLPGALHISLPASAIHIGAKLGKTGKEVLALVRETVSFASGLVSRVELGAEDASRADPDFLADYCGTALMAGAGTVNIADTLGILCPAGAAALTAFLLSRNPGFSGGAVLSIHCHNDMGLACANTLAAVEAGCSQVEVSVSGIGERAGNAALEEVAANLAMRRGSCRAYTGIDLAKVPALIGLAAGTLGAAVSPMKPLSGWNVRAHSAGTHQQGLSRERKTYNVENFPIMAPERIVLSRHSGKAGAALFCRRYLGLAPDGETLAELMARIKNDAAFDSGAVGMSELLGLLGTMGKLPTAYEGPLLISSWSGARSAGRALFRAALRPALAGEPVTETTGRGKTGTSAALDALNRLWKIGTPEMPPDIRLLKRALNGAGSKIRLYAALKFGARLYRLERVGSDAELLLFQCGLDGINAEQFRRFPHS